MVHDLAIINIEKLLPFAGNPERGLRGEEMEESPEIMDGTVAVTEGKVTFVGSTQEFLKEHVTKQTLDAKGRSVIPGFIDAHTHLPFFGWRDGEVAKGRGRSYGSVIKSGGGIKSSIKEMETATTEEILDFVTPLVKHVQSWGTTTIEMKSGYSRSVEEEMRELEIIREISKNQPLDIIPTCLAAHDVPEGYDSKEWINEIINNLLPEISKRNLAKMVDIYIEPFTFSVEDATRLSRAAETLGLTPRAHTDQVHSIGGCEEVVRLEFSSADHLNQISEKELQLLANSNTAAGMLPGSDFTMREKKLPQARKLIDLGALVVLSTNFNPGTSPIGAMPILMGLACSLYDWTPKEAIAASTINAAVSLGIGKERGSIEIGKAADLLILQDKWYELIPYRMGENPVSCVIKNGNIIKKDPSIFETTKIH